MNISTPEFSGKDFTPEWEKMIQLFSTPTNTFQEKMAIFLPILYALKTKGFNKTLRPGTQVMGLVFSRSKAYGLEPPKE